VLVALIALPAAWGDDPPKDDPAKSPKEQYDALVKEFGAKQRELMTDVGKAKGDDRTKLFEKLSEMRKDFAEKFYKLAEDNPNTPAGNDAVFWVVQNANGTPVFAKAMDKMTGLVGEMPLKDLKTRVARIRGGSAEFMDAVLARAEKDEKDPASADLLAWVATNGMFVRNGRDTMLKAIDRLVEKYPDHAAIERVCTVLGGGNVPNGTDTLKKILEKSPNPKVQGSAALALGKALAARADRLAAKPEEADKVAAEAETYLSKAVTLFGESSAAQTKDAEHELKALRTLRVGKEAPDIVAGDLDSKEFKLSDYRGKVVMLDFWGNW